MPVFVDESEWWMSFTLTLTGLLFLVSKNILVSELGHYGLDGWTTSWGKDWVEISLRGLWLMSCALPGGQYEVGITEVYPGMSILGSIPITYIIFINDLEEMRHALSSREQTALH